MKGNPGYHFGNRSILSIVNTIQLSDMKFAKSANKNVETYKNSLQGFWAHWTESSQNCHTNCNAKQCGALQFPDTQNVSIFDVQKTGSETMQMIKRVLFDNFIASNDRLQKLTVAGNTSCNEMVYLSLEIWSIKVNQSNTGVHLVVTAWDVAFITRVSRVKFRPFPR